MHHVFVSYSRSDAAWVVDLTRRLEAAGLTTWLDQRDIPMTLPWFEQIGDAVAAADLFLICDSPASRASANCGAETQMAFATAKYGCQVEVGSDLGTAAAAVLEAAGRIGAADRKRTELSVLARAWDRGGRRGGDLASARERRRLTLGAPAEPALGSVERDFVRASRARARRRAAVSVLVGLAIVASGLIALLFRAVRDQSEATNSEQAAAYAHTRVSLENVGADPYKGLAEAARLGGNESALDASVISGAFETVVPDDGFRVPAAARRFATAEVGGTVAVKGGAGIWGRAAGGGADSARRLAVAPPAPQPPPAALHVRAQRGDRDAAVAVYRDGVLWRRIAFTLPPTVLRLSPDGRELAAGDGAAVEIADLRLGSVRTELGGGLGPIRDLAWSADGRRLWALGGGHVVSWPVRDGAVLLDEPAESIEALLPASRASEAWSVSHSGILRRFAVQDGAVQARRRIDDAVLSAAGSEDGSLAAVSGERGLWLVPLGAGRPRLMKVDCRLGRPTFMSDTTLYLPCLSGPLLRISVPRRKVVQSIQISLSGAFAAKALPHSGIVLASDPLAGLYSVDGGGQVRELFRAGCGGMVTRIGISPDERVIAPVGDGTGLSGCLRRGLLSGDDPAAPGSWTFDAVDDPVESPLAGAGAVSLDGGIFAYGYADGTVVLHPTAEILPDVLVRNVVGQIRDMYVTPENVLLVATDAGIVQRLPLCTPCVSNRGLARVARARIRRGLELGTASRTRG